ncbi:MAG: hypothetical protein HOO86_04390 [Bacteroidales bacterium]|nr:hypothetical protein [Bacteroidales bacterium]
MKTVVAFGESLLDIIYDPLCIIPGGSVLNCAVSLARSGVSVQLMTEFADDGPGKILKGFLERENIGLKYSCIYHGAKTSLAFAVLDDQAKASYTFYKYFPDSRFQNLFPDLNSDSILLFGSFSSISHELNETIIRLVEMAKSAGSLVFYDPNYRSSATDLNTIIRDRLNYNFRNANIIRGSNEDFEAIFDTSVITEVWHKLQSENCKLLIITYGSQKVEAFNQHFHLCIDVPSIQVVSTIGAGDSFNAGFINALIKISESGTDGVLTRKDLVSICIGQAIRFASSVCASTLNYIPDDFSHQMI